MSNHVGFVCRFLFASGAGTKLLQLLFLAKSIPAICAEIFPADNMSSAGSESAPVVSGVEAFDATLFSAICAELEDAKEVQPPSLVVIPGQDGIVKRWAVTYYAPAVSAYIGRQA